MTWCTCSRVLAASKSPTVIAVDPPRNGPPFKNSLSNVTKHFLNSLKDFLILSSSGSSNLYKAL